VSDESTVGEISLDISPDVRIYEVGIGANNLNEMPDDLGTAREVEALVRFKNNGNGPEAVERLLFLGDLPNPTTDLDDEASGIFDEEGGSWDKDAVQLLAGEVKTVFSNTLPFSFEGEGVDCKSTKQTGTFDVVAVPRVESSEVSKTYEIEYGGSEDYNDCEMTIIK
jgi:hypothetical protein